MYVPEIEISIKFKGKKSELIRTVKTAKQAHNLAMEIFNADQIQWIEEFIMLSLNNASEVIGFYRVSKGGMTATVADVRVIATIALNSLATQVIIMHNHPSGSLKPSNSDNNLTKRLFEGLQLLDIKLIDHLIVTPDGYYSYGEEGTLY